MLKRGVSNPNGTKKCSLGNRNRESPEILNYPSVARLPLPRLQVKPPKAGKLYTHMAISKELLEILVCPLCKATVELKPDASGLKCVQCHRVYPIRDDIPVMLIDEARIEE
jgi:uncharacterized protein